MEFINLDLNEEKLTVWDLQSGCQLVEYFAKKFFPDIDIEKHIDLKMTYNKTRPRKHGKEY